MKKKQNYDYGSKSITSWGYVWRTIFYLVPAVGTIFWITRLFAKNRNVRNHARSFFCALVLLLIVAAVAAIGVVAADALGIFDAADLLASVKEFLVKLGINI